MKSEDEFCQEVRLHENNPQEWTFAIAIVTYFIRGRCDKSSLTFVDSL